MKRTTIAATAAGAALALTACGAGTPPAERRPSAEPTARTSARATDEGSRRVDLETPTFSDPTSITNPLFPISDLDQVIQLGDEAGTRLRFEVTRLPATKVIEWDGRTVETVQSQFVAYGDGRVLEVAVDYFAQADDGAVWYFGEQVDNYEDGVIANNDGTWLAGKDGPPGMIMPADPQVGDVYRPENIPDLVFEEVTVLETDQTVPGPRGDVEGAIAIQERLMDGVLEGKTFAPAYGEFQAVVESEQEFVGMGLAVPADFLGGSTPDEVAAMSDGAAAIRAAAIAADWNAVTTLLGDVQTAWRPMQHAVPPLVAEETDLALAAITAAMQGSDPAAAAQGAVDLGQASLDLRLQHLPVPAVDLARFALWVEQLTLDAATGDEATIAGDAAILETIWQRVVHTAAATVGGAVSRHLVELRAAADAGDPAAAADVAAVLAETVAGA